MEKLRLDLDRLEVTSFDAAPEGGDAGGPAHASYPKPNCSAIDLCPTRPC